MFNNYNFRYRVEEIVRSMRFTGSEGLEIFDNVPQKLDFLLIIIGLKLQEFDLIKDDLTKINEEIAKIKEILKLKNIDIDNYKYETKLTKNKRKRNENKRCI